MSKDNLKKPYKANKHPMTNPFKEIGGPNGPEPTRYGVHTPEWEKNGRVSDF
jgi:hypothetical protein